MIDIIKESGIKDTINLIDERTKQLIDYYDYYKYSPHSLQYGIFFETVLILNKIYSQRLI